MQSDALVWKKKYLELLDKKVEAEVDFKTRTELLKRALIRSSLAAEGNDQQLDQQLQLLRTFLRKDMNNNELESHINQLEEAVLTSEANLLQRKAMLGTTLTQLTQQLQQL
ncbi:MAG: GGDEF domain-containing protein, partial [Pseudomonas sp.]|nr:GGDEF domain-containing protein [Pseudomonas sp.]